MKTNVLPHRGSSHADFSNTRLSRQNAQRGLSLVELLVGVAIGLIGLVAIFQMVALSSRHSQTTAAGGDAQVAGTLAIFNIERDLKLGGYGFGTALAPVMGCAVAGDDGARPINFALSPIEIAEGAGGAPDTINVLFGNSSFFVTGETFTNSSPTTKKLQRRNGFRPGDLAVVTGDATALPGSAHCRLVQITDTSNADGYTVAHTTGTYTSAYTGANAVARFNVDTPPVVFTGGTMFSLGPRPQRDTWAIRAGRVLAKTEYIFGSPTADVAEGVINLKAQYGFDANADGQIANAEWTTVAPADWSRVLAIKIAVLVRSRQFDFRTDDANAPVATPAAPTWSGGTFLMTNVDGGTGAVAVASPNNWHNYRYRVYERVVPLRNMLWSLP